MYVQQAKLEDIPSVRTLLAANHVSNVEDKSDGFVTTNMNEDQLAALITKENGITIAKEGDKVLSFAMAASWEFWSEWPFFAYMIEILPNYALDGQILSVENSYQYGPICVDKSFRGSGTFEKVFYSSLASMKERFPIMATFVNQINPRSYAAHMRKVPMTETGTFQFNSNDYYLLACPTDLKSE